MDGVTERRDWFPARHRTLIGPSTSHDLSPSVAFALQNLQGPATNPPTRIMERLEDHNPLLLYAVGVATLYLFYRLLRTDPEVAIPYHVAPPEQAALGWKGEVLQELSMKVSGCECMRGSQLTL